MIRKNGKDEGEKSRVEEDRKLLFTNHLYCKDEFCSIVTNFFSSLNCWQVSVRTNLLGDVPDVADLDDFRMIPLAAFDGAFVNFRGVISGNIQAQRF